MAKAANKKASPPLKTSFWLDDRKVGWMLAIIAFIIYAQTISFGYVLDDIAVIQNNDFVHKGFGGIGDLLHSFYWQGFKAYETANSGIFRPVSLILFAIEWQFAPDSPKFFHFVQVLLYAVTVYQLYRLLRQLFRDYSVSLALIAAGIWIVMPVHTEVVANIKSADEILSVLFFAVAFRQLLNWSDTGKMSSLIIASVSVFLALLSKESAVLFIPVMLLGLMMFRGKKIAQLILPGIFLALVSLIWIGWHTAVISAGPDRIVYDYRNNALLSNPSKLDQIGTAIGLQARYWLKMIFGYPLSYNYSFNEIPVDGFAGIWCWISLIGTGAAAFFAKKSFRNNPVLSFAILFYFITIILTANIFYIIGDIFAERFTFAPSVGFAILLSWLILKFTNGLEEKKIHSKAVYPFLVLGLAYSVMTYSRSSDWKDQTTLFTVDVDHAPNSARVKNNYGKLLLNPAIGEKDELKKKTLLDQAYTQFKSAVEIDTLDFDALSNLGQTEYHRGNFQASADWSLKANQKFRFMAKQVNGKEIDNPQMLMNLGDALLKLQQYDSAYGAYKRGADAYPGDPAMYMKMGNASLFAHDTAQAIESYHQAAKLNPKSIEAWDKVANLCGMRGQYENSTAAFSEILKIDPKNLNAMRMISTNYGMLGDTANAIEYANRYRAAGGQ